MNPVYRRLHHLVSQDRARSNAAAASAELLDRRHQWQEVETLFARDASSRPIPTQRPMPTDRPMPTERLPDRARSTGW